MKTKNAIGMLLIFAFLISVVTSVQYKSGKCTSGNYTENLRYS